MANHPESSASEFETVAVSLGDRSYEIAITSRGLAGVGTSISKWVEGRGRGGTVRSAMIVTDQHVRDRHAAVVADSLRSLGCEPQVVALPPGEQTKSQACVSELYDRLVDAKADRQTLIVAVGGGVIGDLAGFAAATYARGIPFVQVPTTLLAQVDSSVGGKVGINHPRGKNLIGAFHQPLGVFIDTTTLQTLPERDYRSGLAEVVKYGVILDSEFFSFLERNVEGLNRRAPDVLRHVVARSCRLKADVVEQDEYERTGLRAVLNYGHTFGHAFENLAGYGQLLHGEAVAIGMTYAARLAETLGRIDGTLAERQSKLLAALGLPVSLPEADRPSTTAVLDAMRLDKKSLGGKLRFVLPTKLGHVELVEVGEPEVRAVLNRTSL